MKEFINSIGWYQYYLLSAEEISFPFSTKDQGIRFISVWESLYPSLDFSIKEDGKRCRVNVKSNLSDKSE